MSDLVPIPGHPGYSVSPRGEVRSERSGYPILLTHDNKGRVSLRTDGRVAKMYVGELLARVGFIGAGEAMKLKKRLDEAEKQTADFTERLLKAVDESAALAKLASAADSAKALSEMESVRARLREAGGQVADLTARLDRARAESEKLGVDLAKARKANAVLLGIRAEQATRIEALEKTVKSSKPGRGRSARDPLRRDAPMDAPLDFSDPFLREDW